MNTKKSEPNIRLVKDEAAKKKPATKPVKKAKKKKVDPIKKRRAELKTQNRSLLRSAFDISKKTNAKILFVYTDALDDSLFPDKIPAEVNIVLVTKEPNFSYAGSHNFNNVITIPKLKLGRMGFVKITVLLALSAKIVKPEDNVVFLLGKAETESLDTVMTFKIDEESELLTGQSIADLPKSITAAVFEQALNMAIQLGNKGKEGKPVGTIFVLGDEEKVMQLSKQMIINPFKGYEPDERNILNPGLKETIRELSSVDGAFVIAGNGEVISAGRYLGAAMEDAEIPRGLGSRHMAAAGITALTNAVAIVISESTGDVRIFKNGQIIMAIEKPTHK